MDGTADARIHALVLRENKEILILKAEYFKKGKKQTKIHEKCWKK